jgi:hypothetical protein
VHEVGVIIFQIGINYAPIRAKCENKGGDQEKAKVRGFRFFEKEANDSKNCA